MVLAPAPSIVKPDSSVHLPTARRRGSRPDLAAQSRRKQPQRVNGRGPECATRAAVEGDLKGHPDRQGLGDADNVARNDRQDQLYGHCAPARVRAARAHGIDVL